MLTVEHALDLRSYEGTDLGVSNWASLSQSDISDFSRLTGDDHWIHVDVERAKIEMPGGKTIAHGLLVLSFTPVLQRQIYRIKKRGRGLNYGYDRIRFVLPVPVDSRFRLRQGLVSAAPHARGTRLELDVTIELEGSERPAIAARNILLVEDP